MFPKDITHHFSPSNAILEHTDPVTGLGWIVSQYHIHHRGCPKVYRSKAKTGQWSSLLNASILTWQTIKTDVNTTCIPLGLMTYLQVKYLQVMVHHLSSDTENNSWAILELHPGTDKCVRFYKCYSENFLKFFKGYSPHALHFLPLLFDVHIFQNTYMTKS